MNHFQLDIPGDPLPPDTKALLRVSLPSLKTGEQEISLNRAAGNLFEWHGSELSIAGDWTLTAIVRQPGVTDWTATKSLTIGTTPPAADLPGPAWHFSAAGIAGLLLLVLGLAGMVLAALSGSASLRRESAGLGAVALGLGVVLLLQARVNPTSATAEAPAGNPVTRDEASITRGAAAFAANCVVCHGPGAKGDGPGGAGLQPPPADLTALHSQAHQDLDYYNWIQNGKEGTGMPAFRETVDDGTTWDLINYLRSLQGAAAAARDVVGPERCTVEPRTIASLQALAATPDAGPGLHQAPLVNSGAATPVGDPADSAVVAGVTDTLRQFVACSNAQDPLRRLALFSDESIRPAFAKGPSDAFVQLVATPPVPRPAAGRVALAGIDDVRVLPDGRVRAMVTLDDPGAHTHDPGASMAGTLQTATVVFVHQDDRWLIDEGI
ncbi:MAG: cytochrome c [Chloroflexota bacterium]|nr:cytochrome c [Chloroflexota bacterium]